MKPLHKLGFLFTKLAVLPISLILMTLSVLAQTPTVEERLAAAVLDLAPGLAHQRLLAIHFPLVRADETGRGERGGEGGGGTTDGEEE